MYLKLCLAFFLLYVSEAKESKLQITISQGKLKGKTEKSWSGLSFASFLGIPYAKPPVGALRFKRSKPADPWEGILDATKYQSDCPQINAFRNATEVSGEEDCLYINVYTPKLRLKEKKLLPVMFYTHGGGWLAGGGTDKWLGVHFLLDENVIVVTYNYRLGALGFLSTGDNVAPGNNGLKDQNLALKWIKSNIDKFGGDPNQIILFGNSAGGASSHFHILSPLSKDLIQGAILQSGTAFGPWVLGSKQFAEKNTKNLAKNLNCPTSSSKELLECLRAISADDILRATEKLHEWTYDPAIPFRPVIEPKGKNAFISYHPEEIYKSGNVSKVPIIISTTDDDGLLKGAYIFNSSKLMTEFTNEFEKVAPLALLYHENDFHKDISEGIKDFYLKKQELGWSSTTAIVNMFTDSWFLHPAVETIKMHKKYLKTPIYQLIYGYRGPETYANLYGDSSYTHGASHSDELLYLFTTKQYGIFQKNKLDKMAVQTMIKLWTNFAKTGNPTPSSENNLLKWTLANKNDQYYYIDNNVDIKMMDNKFEKRIDFWSKIRTPPKVKEEL